MLCKAEKSCETQMDVQKLMDIGLKQEKALFVLNYFNKQLFDLRKVSDLNCYCQGYLGKYQQVRFVMLHYADGFVKEGKTFEELARYYKSLPEEELQVFENHVKGIDQDEAIDPSVQGAIGVKSASTYMHDMLYQWMDGNRQRVLDALEDSWLVLQL